MIDRLAHTTKVTIHDPVGGGQTVAKLPGLFASFNRAVNWSRYKVRCSSRIR